MKWVKRIGIVLAAVVVLPVLTLVIMGQRSGAGHLRTSTEIQATPDQLWPWVEDGARLKQWVSWLVEVKAWDPPQPGVGAKRVWTMRDENNDGYLMQMEGICTEYAPPTRLTMHLAVKGAFDGTQQYRLTDLGGGRTRLEVESQYHFTDRFAQLMEPLITPSARKKLVGDIARLKSLVETKAEVRR
jgi:uncharacterized protein YndB with AHSA1/START domain